MAIYGKKEVPMENIDLISSQISEKNISPKIIPIDIAHIMRFLYHKYEFHNW